MLAAVRAVHGGVLSGVVATHPTGGVEVSAGLAVFDAGHPSPDAGSAAAGKRALEVARASRAEGGLLVLLSGGASAMLVAPATGITLADKVDATRRLMHAGAAIHELNCVRKHLSRVKGGQLAAAAQRTITLALSDVHAPVADDPSVIGSGPTVPDETTFADALAVIARYRVTLPSAVQAHLERGARGEVDETIKPGDPRLAHATYLVVGSRQTAVEGARETAAAAGYATVVLPDATTGEARTAARAFVDAAVRAVSATSRPVCVIGSGETTVTVNGTGRGGRNQEFALAGAAVLPLLESGGRTAVLGSAGTDGIDGPTDAAGAIVDRDTLTRAAASGIDWRAALANNDAYRIAASAEALLMWGPTGTNVGDLHVVLVAPPLQSSP